MKRGKRGERDPIETYREWAEHRYNPGHWLGANVPPDVRGLWSPRDRKRLGSLYVGTCAIGMAIAVWKSSDWDSLLSVLAMLIPLLIPGLIMLFATDKTDQSGK